MKLNVYGENNEVTKTVEAQFVDIKMGTIRRLMKLLNVDDIEDTATLLKVIYGAWEQLIKILDEVFPDMEEDDWDNVNVSELMPILIDVLKGSFAKMLTIPNDPKN